MTRGGAEAMPDGRVENAKAGIFVAKTEIRLERKREPAEREASRMGTADGRG